MYAEQGWMLGVTEGYRPINRQEAIFFQRYTIFPSLAARRSGGSFVDRKWYRGEYWYLLPGQDLAAVPGTSNHGWGFAVDAGMYDGDGIRPFTEYEVRIILPTTPRFGWMWEVQSEPWHLTYTLPDPWPAPDPLPLPPPPPIQQPEEDEDDMKGFQLVDADNNVYLFLPGRKAIPLGGLPHIHSIMHHQGIAPLVNVADPLPVDQLGPFVARWDA